MSHLAKNCPYLLVILIFALACDTNVCEEEWVYNTYTPVYESKNMLRDRVSIESPRDILKTGALYIYGYLLLIGEPGSGIHIYDNSNPNAPFAISFLAIEGNNNMSVKNDMLYADNYMDLYVFDISDGTSPSFIKRLDDVFIDHVRIQDEMVLVDFIEAEVTTINDCSRPDDFFWEDNVAFFGASTDAFVTSDLSNINSTLRESGIGGSLAKFTVAHDRLYTVSSTSLQVFDISNAECPTQGNEINLGWGIETILPYENYLFFGSQSGMFIYNASDPDAPTLTSQFQHATVCDPVFAIDDRAYVTLRDGIDCRGFINQLDVINIKDITNPKLIKSYDMQNPHGLSVNEEKLIICEGDFGLKVFDRTVELKIDENRLSHIKDIQARDVISLSDDHLLVVGKDGLYQYDSSDPKNLILMSHIVADNE